MFQPETDDRTAARRALVTSSFLVAFSSALVAGYFWDADAAQLSQFSHLLSMDVDLGRCEFLFSRVLAAGSALSIALGTTCIVLIAACLASIYTDKRSFKPYRGVLVFAALVAVALLLPLVNGSGYWLTGGGRRGPPRVELVDACAASHQVIFYRLYAFLGMLVVVGWATIVALLNAYRLIALGRDPSELSKDPRVRDAQLKARVALERYMQRRQSAGTALRVLGCALAGLAFVIAGSTLKFSVSRYYHQLAWDEVPMTVVASGSDCVVEVRRGRSWHRQRQWDCSAEALSGELVHTENFETAGISWRITVEHRATVEHETPDGRLAQFELRGEFYLPEPKIVGSRILLLRNPEVPTNFDHVFDQREIVKTQMRIAVVATSAVALFFLWPGVAALRGRRFQPNSTA